MVSAILAVRHRTFVLVVTSLFVLFFFLCTINFFFFFFQGKPLSKGVKYTRQVVGNFHNIRPIFRCISLKRYKTGPGLLWSVYRKS